MDLKKAIKNIRDFPIEGIVFRDIMTLIADSTAFKQALDEMEKYCRSKKPDIIVGIESRGFIFGAALADRLGIGFVTVRKVGKLPPPTIKYEYELEYGTDAIEISDDTIKNGDKVIVVDDLIATGGTLDATCQLVEKAGGEVVGISAVINLAYLPWRDKVGDRDVNTLVQYDEE
ncbi:MAG: adenine phosphoribosyltransferase [Candidatus Zixiibacteriota bacterium]